MSSLGMRGPLAFNIEQIDESVRVVSAGNYALGKTNERTGRFIVRFVGRSDNDLNTGLKSALARLKSRYSEFKFCYAETTMAAYVTECRTFHEFGGFEHLDNTVHPIQPGGEDFPCPYCSIFDR